MLAEVKRSMLCLTGGKAPPGVVGRVGLVMLMKGGRTGKLDQPSLEGKPGCHMWTSTDRMVAWPTENSDSAWHETCLATRTQRAM